jgi:soluble lytic murein transglycosylase-like protein
MLRRTCIAAAALALVVMTLPASAQDRRTASLDANGNLDALIAQHAAANNVPASLIRRVIKRESGGNSRAVSRGNYGLMQIRLGTARSLGYRGSAAGLLDPATNMEYAVKYLAGAYRVAAGNADRAVHYYASGYYYAAKRKGMTPPPAAERSYAMQRDDTFKAAGKTAGPVDTFKAASTASEGGTPSISPASLNFR